MQTVADMRGVGVKNRGKFEDVLCGRPLTSVVNLACLVETNQEVLRKESRILYHLLIFKTIKLSLCLMKNCKL